MSYSYIASPYSHPNPEVRQARFYAVMAFTAQMLKDEVWCYSPIVHCHELSVLHSLPTDAVFWKNYNYAMLERAESLMVLMLPGWRGSKGVANEIFMARNLGLSVNYMEVLDEGNITVRCDRDNAEGLGTSGI